MKIAPGATDVTTYFKLVDPASGVPETGLTITDLDATYVRDRAAAVKADLTALAAVDSAHGDNKAIQVDATNAPGLYRVDWPDAAFASGVDRVQLVVNGAAIDPAVIEVELETPQTGDAYARLGAPAGASVSADLANVPTVTEFEARTIAAADYTIVSDLPTVPSAADNATAVAAAILVTPANKLETDASGYVSGITGTKNTLDALNDITVADIIAGISDGSLDLQEMMRIILAAVAGKASGGGTTTIKFRDQADTLDRITATVDANGNRTAVTVDGS